MKEQYFAAADPWTMLVGIIVVALVAGLVGGVLYGAHRCSKAKIDEKTTAP